MYLNIKGLVLRVSNYNDHDAMLTILTGTHGKLSVKARGLRRKYSPLTAPCQLLAYSEFTLFEYKGLYTINEARSVELFHTLQRDLQKLSLGTYFAQVSEVLSQEDLPNPELLSLVLNCLFALSKLEIPEEKVKAVFDLRSTCLAGYTPDLHGCHRCGNTSADQLDLSSGQLECCGCRDRSKDGIRMPLTPGALDAMRYISACDSKLLFQFDAGGASLRSLADASEAYLTTQLERGFSALDFYKSLQIDI